MQRFALALAVALGLLIAWAASRPPGPRPVDAPATVFSAGRAMSDVRVIAREPHPVGSPANARVRDHLLARLRALGLAPVVQRGERAGVVVENVIGRLPGEDRAAPPLLLMAHYDSVPRSPGAADDAAGVAAILEALRAFSAAERPPARDVVVLLTDGEERGLHGAQVYFRTLPAAERPAVVLNFEARGGAGRTYMFETGPDNAALIDVFRRSVAAPSASSLARFVYDRMPNGTDFTVPKRQGVAGLNFAFIGDEAAYHTPLATPERLDQGSLQHMGDQALAMLTALSTKPEQPAAGGDAVYADVFGLTLIAYPPAFGWVLLAVASGLITLAGWRDRKEPRPLAGMAGGAIRLLFGSTLAGLLMFFARQVLSEPGEGLYRAELLAHPGWLLTGVAVVLAGAILIVWSGRPSRFAALGALTLGLAVGTALQALAPETAFIFTWPVLIGAALAALRPRSGPLAAVLAVTAGALGSAWIAGLLHLLFLSLGLLVPEALAAGALLLPLVLHPLLGSPQAAARRAPVLT